MDPLVLTLLVIGGSIFGIWLGQQLQTHREDRSWRHDQRLQAYTSYLAALANYELTILWMRTGPPKTMEQLERLAANVVTLSTAREAIRLVGAKGVVDEVEKITVYTDAKVKAQQDAIQAGQTPEPLDLTTQVAAFVVAARTNLGFHN